MSNSVNQFRSFFQNRLDKQTLARAKATERSLRGSYHDAMIQLDKINAEKTKEYEALKEKFYQKYVTDVVEEFKTQKNVTEQKVQSFKEKTTKVYEFYLENAWAPIARQYEANMSLYMQIKTEYENSRRTIESISNKLGIDSGLDEGKTLQK